MTEKPDHTGSAAPSPPTTPPPSPPAEKPNWLRFFESASGPTLITALIGTLITVLVQNGIKVREQARAEAKVLIETRFETVQKTFVLTGKMVGTAEDLIVLKGPEYDLTRFHEPELSRVTNEIHTLLDAYNATDREWRTSRYAYGMLLAYYHPRQQDVPGRWSELAHAVDDYAGCARTWSVEHDQPVVYDGSCDDHRKRVDAAVAAFSAAIGSTPR